MKEDQTEIIDGTIFGDVYEACPYGDKDTSNTLSSLLVYLHQDYSKILKPNTKILVLYSYLGYNPKIYRYSKEKVRTFSYLLRLYRELTENDFNLEKAKEDIGFRFELMEKEAEKRSAWGYHSRYLYLSEIEDKSNKKDKDSYCGSIMQIF